jgi:hypothetical protein
VLDSFGVCWNYAEMLVSLHRRLKITVGRAWEYARPLEAKMARFRQIVSDPDG